MGLAPRWGVPDDSEIRDWERWPLLTGLADWETGRGPYPREAETMTTAELSAKLDNGPASAAPDADSTIHVLEVAAGEVTFTLTADAELDSAQLKRGSTELGMTLATDKKSATVTVDIDSDVKRGLYSATAKDSANGDVTVKNQVEIKPKSGGGNPAPSGVTEASLGEYDKDFADKSLVAVGVLAVGGLLLALVIIGAVSLPPAGTNVVGEVTRDGTFTERVAAMIYAMAAALGVAITLFGAWQAALETRGRLSTNLKGAPSGSRGPDYDGMTKVLDVVRRLRGTIVVIVAGALIVGLALFFTSRLPAAGLPSDGPSSGPSNGASNGPSSGPSEGGGAPPQAPTEPEVPGSSASP